MLPVKAGKKEPRCTLTLRQRKAADKSAALAAKERGARNWERVKHSGSGQCGVHHAITEPEVATRIFKRMVEESPGLNLGIEVGRSKVLMVDCDSPEAVHAFAALWAEQEGISDLAEQAPTVRSPRGGHFYFMLPEGVDFIDAATARPVTRDGYDIFFKDRLAVVPPSVRPDGEYVLASDAGEAPEWLVGMVRKHLAGYQERATRNREKVHSSDDPISLWAASLNWEEFLEPDGWGRPGRFDTCQCEVWTRPGDDWNSLKSATAHDEGCTRFEGTDGLLHVWSSAVGGHVAAYMAATSSESMSKLQYVAWRDYEGNYTAAMSELRIQARGEDYMTDEEVLAAVEAEEAEKRQEEKEEEARYVRIVDLSPFLDGSWQPPSPDIGVARTDGKQLLYAGKWHTCIGLTGCGKSWWALVHAVAEMEAGHVVAYLHFEEAHPGGTVDRLRALGVPVEVIREKFKWVRCDRAWRKKEFVRVLAEISPVPTLVVLDGLNAACSKHGQDVQRTEAVGWYRDQLVTPATTIGSAVLSLGHPVKDPNRQDERHSYGSTAWLDECDGVGFRLKAGKVPIQRDASGSASLHVVKDRYGMVQQDAQAGTSEGWFYAGQVVVENLGGATQARLVAPSPGAGASGSPLDELATEIQRVLDAREGKRYPSERELISWLRAADVKFRNLDLSPALERMEQWGDIGREPYNERQSRAGWLMPGLPASKTQEAGGHENDL